jgi:hypothetical protein
LVGCLQFFFCNFAYLLVRLFLFVCLVRCAGGVVAAWILWLGWLVGWLVGWLISWLVGWLVSWFAGWLVDLVTWVSWR